MITAHGRVATKMIPPAQDRLGRISQFDQLIASGQIKPPAEGGDPLEGCPKIRLAPGTVADLIDRERGEA